MSAISCSDKCLKPVISLIGSVSLPFNPAVFQNPMLSVTVGLGTNTTTTTNAVIAARAMYSPSDPNYINLTSLITALGTMTVATAQCTAWNNFQGGQSYTFPASTLAPITGAIVGIDAVAALTFGGMLSVALGGKASQDALCNLNPSFPCLPIQAIFGALGSAFSAVLGGLASTILAMTDFVVNFAAYIAQIAAGVAAITAQIVSDINGLVSAVMACAQFAMAKALVGFSLDPCMGSVMLQIGTPSLNLALGAVPGCYGLN